MIGIREFWAGSVALSQSLSWLARVLSTLPIPTGPWCHCQGQSAAPRPTDAHLTPSETAVFEALCVGRVREGVTFMHLVLGALHLTLQARYPHCSGCHFELKQVGFTAADRARQSLLVSRNTFIYSELGFCSHTGLNLAHGISRTYPETCMC
jgi:hypothetical protein